MSLKESSNKVKLTDEQKERIFRCIRYSFLPQEALLKLSTDPDFFLAKELIVQGLACKLGGGDQFASEDLKITMKPRIALECAQGEIDGINHGGAHIVNEIVGARQSDHQSMGGMTQMGKLLHQG